MDNNFDTKGETPKAKGKGKYSRMRGLTQYKDLSDDEFQKIVEEKSQKFNTTEEFEKRISKKLTEFEEDYDLSDMKINDKDSLRALIQAHISLEDYEQVLFNMRNSGGITEASLYTTEKLQKVMSDLRADISKLQNDLNITRKIRKSDQDVSVLAFITNLKEKAKKHYESKMSYIFCPKCNLLLGTIWTLYPEENNKISLTCNRTLDDGSKCGNVVTITTKELWVNRGTNNKDITPESMI